VTLLQSVRVAVHRELDRSVKQLGCERAPRYEKELFGGTAAWVGVPYEVGGQRWRGGSVIVHRKSTADQSVKIQARTY